MSSTRYGSASFEINQSVTIKFNLKFDEETTITNSEKNHIHDELIDTVIDCLVGSDVDVNDAEIEESIFDDVSTFKANKTYEACFIIDFCVTVSGPYSYTPAQTYGRPEDCYPEDEEFEPDSGSIDYVNDEKLAKLIDELPIIGEAIQLDTLSTDTTDIFPLPEHLDLSTSF